MTDYQKAKVLLTAELGGKATAGTINKWFTLSVSSMDIEFATRCKEFGEHLNRRPNFTRKWGYDSYINPIKVRDLEYTGIKGWTEIFRLLYAELLHYVDFQIASNKPTWQVTAENMGWTPPLNWK